MGGSGGNFEDSVGNLGGSGGHLGGLGGHVGGSGSSLWKLGSVFFGGLGSFWRSVAGGGRFSGLGFFIVWVTIFREGISLIFSDRASARRALTGELVLFKKRGRNKRRQTTLFFYIWFG